MNKSASAAISIVAVACSALAAARWPQASGPPRMSQAAARFIASLGPTLAAKGHLPFESPARTDWHYVPRNRAGLSMKDMNDEQRRAAHELLRSALSDRGYLKAGSIMQLDAVLHDMETAAGRDGSGRDPELYHFAVFGTPGDGKPWGWKVEGHHLSLNFSSVSGDVMDTTPWFMGANPAEVEHGPRAGWRVLATEEDLGRELLESLGPEQRAKAIIAAAAPSDIIMGPGRDLAFEKPEGLAASEMSPAQRSLLVRLIEVYAQSLEHDLAASQMERITTAGVEKVFFAWAGGAKPGEGHYYRLQGPTFVIELDNTQDHANHVHTVWRDPEKDFGKDLLREHYQRDHAVPPAPPGVGKP
jgi:hypothetical protein